MESSCFLSCGGSQVSAQGNYVLSKAIGRNVGERDEGNSIGGKERDFFLRGGERREKRKRGEGRK